MICHLSYYVKLKWSTKNSLPRREFFVWCLFEKVRTHFAENPD